MKVGNISFPHPVLGVSDDVRGFYKFEASVVMSREKITLSIKHLLSNPTLHEFISTKKAFFAVEVDCPQTLFRATYLSDEESHTIEIAASELRNNVEVSFWIVANENMIDYAVDGANKDYAGYDLEIGKGDVLAYGGELIFNAGKTWGSPLSIESMFDIQKDKKKEGPMTFYTSDEKIIIRLSERDHAKYAEISRDHRFHSILHSSIAFPALMFALTEMMDERTGSEDDAEKNDGCEWKQVLANHINSDEGLKKIGWDKTKIPEIAQILLKDPANRMFDSLNSIIYQE